MKEKTLGRSLAILLAPQEDDYFVFKAKNSGFFGTALEIILNYLGAKNVILTGISTENCVYLTAADAFMRDLNIFVPVDCVASTTEKEKKEALQRMKKFFRAHMSSSRSLSREKFKS